LPFRAVGRISPPLVPCGASISFIEMQSGAIPCPTIAKILSPVGLPISPPGRSFGIVQNLCLEIVQDRPGACVIRRFSLAAFIRRLSTSSAGILTASRGRLAPGRPGSLYFALIQVPIPETASDASAIPLGGNLLLGAQCARLRRRGAPFSEFGGSVAANHPAHHCNDCQYQQNVNESSHRVRREHAGNPKSKQDNAHEKHRKLPCSFVLNY
jgi:hypothetical protein